MDNDFGIKISPRNINAFTAPDYTLIHNSAWVIPKILFKGEYVDAGDGSVIVEHDLGYVPMFLCWVRKRGITPTYENGVAALETLPSGTPVANAFTLVAPAGSSNLDGVYMVFDVDIESPLQAPILIEPHPVDEPAIDRDFGIKISLPGKDVNSEDTRDLALDSNMRSPQIASVNPGSKGNDSTPIVIDHELGYPPVIFVYVKLDGETNYKFLAGGGTDYSVSSTNESISVVIPYACAYSVIILKDPFRLS